MNDSEIQKKDRVAREQGSLFVVDSDVLNARGLLSPTAFQLYSDVIAGIASLFIFYAVRSSLVVGRSFPLSDLMTIAALTVSGWVCVFWFAGLYKNFYYRSPFEEAFTLFKVSLSITFVLYLMMHFTDEQFQLERLRLRLFVYWFCLFVSASLFRFFFRRFQRLLRRQKKIGVPCLIVGSPHAVHELLTSIRLHPMWGYQPIGVVFSNAGAEKVWNESQLHHRVPVVGLLAQLPTFLQQYKPQEVLIAMDEPNHEEVLRTVSVCSAVSVATMIVPDLYEVFSGQARTLQIYGRPFIEVSPELLEPWQLGLKRLFDILGSLLVLIVSSPAWTMVALLIAFSRKGGILFRQDRVGKNGVVFSMLKFRSLISPRSTEQSLTSEIDTPTTFFSRCIAKTHLDEIPQFWNVLKGDMSLVGPRPEQPFFVKKYGDLVPYYSRRHKVRPGITGWWQVNTNSGEESLQEIANRLKYDFFYIENISLKLDFEIMVRTIFVMIKGHGAA